jgi:uncharacterized membrane protein
MFQLPHFSSWAALHPGLSHFPIALLLLVPALVLAALLAPGRRQGLMEMAVWVLAVGTAFIYLSAASGDAAKEIASQAPDVVKAIAAHEDLGSAARAVFSALAILLAALVYGPRVRMRTVAPRVLVALTLGFLVLYAAAALILLNAAHSGGILVHQLGVHAKLY